MTDPLVTIKLADLHELIKSCHYVSGASLDEEVATYTLGIEQPEDLSSRIAAERRRSRAQDEAALQVAQQARESIRRAEVQDRVARTGPDLVIQLGGYQATWRYRITKLLSGVDLRDNHYYATRRPSLKSRFWDWLTRG